MAAVDRTGSERYSNFCRSESVDIRMWSSSGCNGSYLEWKTRSACSSILRQSTMPAFALAKTRASATASGQTSRYNFGVAPRLTTMALASSRDRRVQNPWSSTTSISLLINSPAICQSRLKIRSWYSAKLADAGFVPYSFTIHSSWLKHTALRSDFSLRANVVFPVPGKPWSKWTVLIFACPTSQVGRSLLSRFNSNDSFFISRPYDLMQHHLREMRACIQTSLIHPLVSC